MKDRDKKECVDDAMRSQYRLVFGFPLCLVLGLGEPVGNEVPEDEGDI